MKKYHLVLKEKELLFLLSGVFLFIKTNNFLFSKFKTIDLILNKDPFYSKKIIKLTHIKNISFILSNLINYESKYMFFRYICFLNFITNNNSSNQLFKQIKNDISLPEEDIKLIILESKRSYLIHQKAILEILEKVLDGLNSYFLKYNISAKSWNSTRHIYCITNGLFNSFTLLINQYFKPVYKNINLKDSLFENMDCSEIVSKLKNEGYYIFETKIPEKTCNDIVTYSLKNTGKYNRNISSFLPIYDKTKPLGPLYKYNSEVILKNNYLKKIITDNSILNIAQNYLGCKPVIDVLNMWWSTNYLKGEADSSSAQLFHFDMDRLNFLKLFIYLTDVNEKSGFQSYIKKSHNYLPKPLRVDRRLSNKEIRKYYNDDNFVNIKGKKGTIFIVDTKGLHKGNPPIDNDRLIFQCQFSDSLFGVNYPKMITDKSFIEEYRSKIKDYSYSYSGFRVKK